MQELLTAPKRVRACDCEARVGFDDGTFLPLAGRLQAFLLDVARRGETVAAWGASPEGAALLCAAAVGREQVTFTIASASPASGRGLPCTGIPVRAPGHLEAERPDWLIVLPGTDLTEVGSRAACIRSWGGRLVVPGANLEIVS